MKTKAKKPSERKWTPARCWHSESLGDMMIWQERGRFSIRVYRMGGGTWYSSATTLRRAQLLAERFWSELGKKSGEAS